MTGIMQKRRRHSVSRLWRAVGKVMRAFEGYSLGSREEVVVVGMQEHFDAEASKKAL